MTIEEAKKLLSINVISFNYIPQLEEKTKEELMNMSIEEKEKIKKYGVIAEDVNEIIPYVVSIPEDYDPEEPLNPMNVPNVDYSKFVPYLIKIIQI